MGVISRAQYHSWQSERTGRPVSASDVAREVVVIHKLSGRDDFPVRPVDHVEEPVLRRCMMTLRFPPVMADRQHHRCRDVEIPAIGRII